jgi:tungstate transport system substrate-binding protein
LSGWRLALLVVAALGHAAHAADLRLGATHTLEDSGVLAVLIPAFEAASRVRVRALIAASGQVMKYAEAGDVDILFTHSRADEQQLVARGIGATRVDVMWNDFVIAGPRSDPAKVRGLHDAPQALRRIRESGAKFVSRADESGTHRKEMELWAAAGGLGKWSGYLSSGQGAGRALMMAHELDAYDLVDRATLKQLEKRFPLAILVEGDARLLNEYAVTTLVSTPARPVRQKEADAFAAWIVSPAARALISGYRVGGERVFRLNDEPKAIGSAGKPP